jgi:glycosyltransferase involved in cell wall biosynthesis
MSKPVSLIIAFYNKIDLLKFVFAGLERQTFREFEVVIADDGSNPDIVKEITSMKSAFFFPIKQVWHEDKGWQKTKILNKAVMAAEGDYLIFIDGDCIPHPKFIQEHMENRAQNATISGRRILLTQKVSSELTLEKIRNGYLDRLVAFPLLVESVFHKKDTQVENMLHIRNKLLRRIFIKEKVRDFWGCNFSVWKKDLLTVNGFDERYVHPGYGEDCDLDHRLRRIGIFPMSKKHLITVFHVYHDHFETNHEPNILLWKSKKITNETYTPFGIIQDQEQREKTNQ